MSSILTAEELDRLGLGGASSFERESIALPDPDVAEAAGIRDTAISLAAVVGMANASFLGLGSAVIRAADLTVGYLRDEPRICRVISERPGTSLRVEVIEERIMWAVGSGGAIGASGAPTGGADDVATGHARDDEKSAPASPSAALVNVGAPPPFLIPEDDAGTCYVDWRRARRLVIRAGGSTVVFDCGERALQIETLLNPVVVPPMASLESPVRDWCGVAGDAWLTREVEQALAFRSPWKNAVAVAIFARLVELPPALRKAAVEHTLAGRPDPVLSPPRAWARSLDDRERRTLESLALAETDRVRLALESFEAPRPDADAAPGGAGGWQEEWLDLCCRRDDLEAVRLILAEARSAEVLDEALTELDREARGVALDTPVNRVTPDERLRRAARLEPGAWWTEVGDAQA